MKKFLMMGCAAGVVGAADYSASAAAVGTTSAPVRFDGRTGNLVATGVERRGGPAGGLVTTWNTASEADGWRSFTVGEETVSILALNEVAVEGGRLVTNEVWSADRVLLSYTFDVSANARWSASTESDWIFVPEDNGNGEGDGDGRVVFIVEFNKSAAARTGTIRVALTGTDIFRDFTVTQDGMATLAAPTISPADGTTFSGAARRVSISGIPDGATVRYTLDGSEPTATAFPTPMST